MPRFPGWSVTPGFRGSIHLGLPSNCEDTFTHQSLPSLTLSSWWWENSLLAAIKAVRIPGGLCPVTSREPDVFVLQTTCSTHSPSSTKYLGTFIQFVNKCLMFLRLGISQILFSFPSATSERAQSFVNSLGDDFNPLLTALWVLVFFSSKKTKPKQESGLAWVLFGSHLSSDCDRKTGQLLTQAMHFPHFCRLGY